MVAQRTADQARVAQTLDVLDVIDVLADWFAEGMPRSQASFALISQTAAVDPAALR